MRRIQSILTIFSLILLLIVIADRVSHFWRANELRIIVIRDQPPLPGGVEFTAITGQGQVMISLTGTREPGAMLGLSPGIHFSSNSVQQSGAIIPSAAWPGFDAVASRLNPTGGLGTFVYLLAPNWFLAAIFAILPVRWAWRRHRDRNRPREGFCAKCGYDLRASKERCPECGMSVRFISTNNDKKFTL